MPLSLPAARSQPTSSHKEITVLYGSFRVNDIEKIVRALGGAGHVMALLREECTPAFSFLFGERFTGPLSCLVYPAKVIHDLTYGQGEALIERLGSGNVQAILAGTRSCLLTYTVDLDRKPPEDGEAGCVIAHRAMGEFKWDPARVGLEFTALPDGTARVSGDDVSMTLASSKVFNANLLNFLLRNQHLSPESWKEERDGRYVRIYFWGTRYWAGVQLGEPGIRYMRWNPATGLFGSSWSSLDTSWGAYDAACVLIE